MPLYSIQGPDGKTYSIEGPPGATREQVIQAIQARMQESAQTITAPPVPQPEQSGVLRQILDVPLQIVRGGVGGIRMLADVFGAGSSASEALKSADTWLADLLSSQAKDDQRRIAEILKEAEDKGVLAQVGAGLRALATAPVDTLAQALGSTAPVIIAGLVSGPAGAALGLARAGAAGVGAARAGSVAMPAVGAAMGVGEVKGSIYEAVEQEYLQKGASPEVARAKALEAQSYASANLPSMVVGGGLGALAGGLGIERPLASMLSRGAVRDVAEQQALREAERGLASRVGLGALREGAPEFAQAGQSQLAQNLALINEGFDVPLFRNVFGAGAMEGAAGAILGGGLAIPRTGVERLPGQRDGESDSDFARRMSREIDAARRREQVSLPTAPIAPGAPTVSTEDVYQFPDGSVGTMDQAKAYAMGVPVEQRQRVLADILSKRVPKEKTAPDLLTEQPTEAVETKVEPAEKPVEAEKPAEITEPPKPPAVALTKEEEEVAEDATKEKPVQNYLLGYPIYEIPIEQLSLSKDVPQFKGDADVEGVVERLEGTFDQRGVAPIQVWKRTDGRLEIISGRHRFDLAKRSGEKLIRAQIHEEATGFDADQASILDAELNIRDQQGKGRDYVAYFRKSGISEADAKARGLLGRAPGKPAFAIAKNGSDELVAAHRADIVSDAGAAAIANAAPGDSRLQAVGVKAIQEGKSPLAAVNTIKAVQSLSKDRPPTEGGDLFGFDDSAMREAEEMAKIATSKQNQLAQRIAAISGASRRPEIAKKEGIDIKDPEALQKREKELRQQKAAWDNWPSSPGLVEEIRKEMTPEAKPSVREAPEQKELPAEIQAKVNALGKALKRILTRYGLGDVAVRLVEDMKAEGEYASKVLSLALDATDPVVALRHEAIHALKELGFFTPQQWKSLERQAKEKWVDQYLKQKNVNRQPLQEGQMSRYDAYMKFYGGDEEAIIEEAIADAFGDFSVKAPPGMLQAILKRLKNLFQGIKEAFGAEPEAERIFVKAERGQLRAGPVAPDSWKDTEQEEKDAEQYEEQNGIRPYTSAGQIEVPVETPKQSIKAPYKERELAKGKKNHPVLNVPLNANGTVTLYFPTSNLSAREVAKTKRLKATSPTANRIYLTNESNPAAVRALAGNIDQGPIEANVMVHVPPEMLQFDMEHADGRKDFFIQLAEGNAFAEKMKMTKLFNLYKPRSEAIAKTTTINDIANGLESAISAYKQLSPADQRAKLALAQQVLKDEHNVGTLLGENGKLQKTRLNEYQLPEDIKNSVASLGLGLASAQKINERNLSTCPQSARCEGLCLGETSGQNQLYGGDGPFRAGPRLSQYLKTEALVMHPEEFGIVLYDEIKKFESKAKSDKGFEVITDENGKERRVKKQVYTPAIRLNVTSDFPPKMLKPFIESFPDVWFYDYTKLATPGPIAKNHHLTYSSDGAAQVVEGKTVGIGSNWNAMIKRLNSGFNVAMAFTSKNDMPEFVLDEKTGNKFQVWNGDNYDARFLDPRPGQKGNIFNKGMIIGLTNKDRTGRPEDAALRHDGFFVEYDRGRNGDTVVIRDQDKIKEGKKIIPISVGKAKPSLRDTVDVTRLYVDVPNEEWLQSQIDYAIKKGRNRWGVPYMGKITASYRKGPVDVPVSVLEKIPGQRDEQNNRREESLDYIRKNWGAVSKEPPYIEVAYNGEAWVSEGNHRIMVAAEKGIKSLPVEIRYFDGGERKAGPLAPNRILDITKSAERDPTNPDIRYSLRDKLGLYSELENKLGQGPNTAPAAQWKSYINALPQKGVKPEEIQWSGVNDWLDLQGQPVPVYESGYGLMNEWQDTEGGKWTPVDDMGEYFRTKQEAEAAITDEMVQRQAKWAKEEGAKSRIVVTSFPGEELDFGKKMTPRISKEDILNYLKRGGVQVEEAVLGGRAPWRERMDLLESRGYRNLNANEREELQTLRDRFEQEGQTPEPENRQAKYTQYTLPGGENYREVLLTLPFKVDAKTQRLLDEERYLVLSPEEQATVDAAKKRAGIEYRSRHWDQPNVIAHIRVNDRTDADGNRVLFVEEIQSDWGQEGKKKGFRNDLANQKMFANESRIEDLESQIRDINFQMRGLPYSRMDEFNALADERQKLYDEQQRLGEEINLLRDKAAGEITPAPFVTKTEGWLNLALKRIMVMAAEGGYDKVAFVNGEQSADRYKLSKEVDEIHWRTYRSGEKSATVDLKNKDSISFLLDEGGMVSSVSGVGPDEQSRYTGKPFDEIVGKEVAESVMATPSGVLEGAGLDIGGKGMKTFYDTIVPTAVKKLLPKVGGGQMGIVRLGDGAKGNFWADGPAEDGSWSLLEGEDGSIVESGLTRSAAEAAANERNGAGLQQPGFTITPAMQDRVRTTGLPRFSLRDTVDVPGGKRVSPELEKLGVTPAAVDLFLKYRAADRAVGDDPYTAGRGAKAAKTRAFNQLVDALGGDDEARVPLYRMSMAFDMRGEDGLYADTEQPSTRASLRGTINPAVFALADQITTPRDDRSFIKRIIDAISPKSASHFRAANLDRYDILSVNEKELVKQMGGAPLLADVSAHAAALMSDLSAGVLASAMGVHDGVGGIPVYNKGYTYVINNNNTVKGPIAIFAPLAKYNDPDIYRLYQTWAAVKRGIRLYGQGRPTGIIDPADQATIAALPPAMVKEFEDIQKEWIKFNDGLVKYLVDTGVLSVDQGKEFVKYSDYIPFYRQAEGEKTVGPQIFASLSGVRQPKKLKESEAPIGEFLETVIRNVQYSIEAGMKNVAAQRSVRIAESIGMAQRLNYVSSAPNVVKVLENGQTKYYAAQDMLFVEAMKSLNLGDLPFIGLLAGPANLLRALVTKDPAFMLANMMRDSMSAWVSTGVNMTPMIDTLTNFTKALAGNNPEYAALLNSGVIGGYDYSQGLEASAERFNRELRKAAGVSSTGEKLAKPFTSLWDALEKGTTASDAATRMEIYKKTLAETGNEAEAIFRSLEVMNFNRKGNNPLVRVLTAAVPFLNARMQGLDVLYRAAFAQGSGIDPAMVQKRFFVRGMTIAALSAMYWTLVHEDDEWKKQEQETRDNYWILGDVKIPIPFEIGVLFKVIPERILEYSFGNDTGKDFMKSMVQQLTNTLAFNPFPQTVLPALEYATNYSFFTRRPIVSQGLEDVAPAYQIAPGTSRIGELAGEATKGLPTSLQLSPVKVDELIRGYTGTIGGYMMDLFDAIYDMNADAPKAAKRFEQMPVIRRFAVDPEARGQVTAYYELKNAVDEATRTANLLERNMNPQEWGEFMEQNMGLLATKDYVLDLEKSMKQYREMKNMVRASTMSADEKKDVILDIIKLENQLASNIQEIKKMIAAQ